MPSFWMSSLRAPCSVARASRSRTFSSAPNTSSTQWRAILLSGITASAAAYYFCWPYVLRGASTDVREPLSPTHFIPVKITSCTDTTRDTKLLTLTVPPHLRPSVDSPALAPIWSIYIKDDELQIERPYTPLEGIGPHGRMAFWIKRYPNGEVGRWLHSKKEGDTLEIRGPVKTWEWQDGAWDEVVMISGGTGITPMYQLLHHFINQGSSSGTKTFTLLHSSRTPADLPPPAILQPLTSFAKSNPERFKLHLFVDSLDGCESPAKLHVGQIDEKSIISFGLSRHPKPWWKIFSSESTDPESNKILFVVCGPQPMINAIAGPFGIGQSQGQVGGVLGRLGFSSSQVRKL